MPTAEFLSIQRWSKMCWRSGHGGRPRRARRLASMPVESPTTSVPATGEAPVMQFFTRDWLGDPELSKCSPGTRGVWMDLLAAMHESDRCGEIRGTPEQLARIARCTGDDVRGAAQELRDSGAADVRIGNGVVTL